jgi:molybdate transport system ATP-binding protein
MSGLLSLQLAKRYPGFTLEATLEAEPGITALFGPSGGGKTTLIDMVAGIRRPDSGRILLDGEPLFDAAAGINLAPEKRRIGYVFQDGLLFPHMNVRQNLLYGVRGSSGADFGDISALLGLEDLLQRYPATLSGGEKQRTAIGRALLSNPRVLLMDEPLSNIDPARREAFFPYLERVRDEMRLPILYVSHQLDEIVRLADRAALISEGCIRASGPIEELFRAAEMKPYLGYFDAGVVLTGSAGEPEHGLVPLQVAGGRFLANDATIATGATVRLRILARDVAIARRRPEDISILNVLECRIAGMTTLENGEVDVDLLLQETASQNPDHLTARITRWSVERLGLQAGDIVFAMIKAVAIARGHGPGA